MKKVCLVKVFEPATPAWKLFSHPDRYRFVWCWVDQEEGNLITVTPVGGQGCFDFVNGKCDHFWSYRMAEIVKIARSDEVDPFEGDFFQELRRDYPRPL